MDKLMNTIGEWRIFFLLSLHRKNNFNGFCRTGLSKFWRV